MKRKVFLIKVNRKPKESLEWLHWKGKQKLLNNQKVGNILELIRYNLINKYLNQFGEEFKNM